MSADLAFVTRVMRDPRVWRSVAEDGLDPLTFNADTNAHYFQHGEQGFLMFRQISTCMFEIHIAMLKGARGVDQFVEDTMQRMHEMGARKFLATLPEWNRAGIAIAERSGFKHEGRVEDAYMRSGKLHAMILMGKTL
jgi:hypothetical protein